MVGLYVGMLEGQDDGIDDEGKVDGIDDGDDDGVFCSRLGAAARIPPSPPDDPGKPPDRSDI